MCRVRHRYFVTFQVPGYSPIEFGWRSWKLAAAHLREHVRPTRLKLNRSYRIAGVKTRVRITRECP